MINYDATGPQKRAITKLCVALGVKEPIEEGQMTSGEAGSLIRELYGRLKVTRRSKRKVKSGRG